MKPEGAQPQAAALLYLCVGLFGVQVVWGLQNANTSRVFQWLGADVGQLAVFWIAGPVTGALVQPIVGYLSDRTVGRWGRRRPYILVGALMSALALVLFVNASTLPAAVAMLWFLGFSANVAMEPIRALTADLIPVQQQSRAYALQAAFIGGGAIIASALPWLFGHFLGTAAIAGSSLPAEVRYAFYTGAALVVASVGWMVFGTREHVAVSLPVAAAETVTEAGATAAGRRVAAGIAWTIAGLLGAWAAAWFHMRPEMYLLAFLVGGFGVGQASVGWLQQRGRAPSGLLEIIADILRLPLEMRQLAVVQFFTWLGLFVVWVYLVPAVAEQRFGTSNPATREYQWAADWVGVLFALYNAFAVLAAPLIARAGVRFGQRRTHSACLFLGALGFVAIQGVPAGQWPWLPALLTGIAWASILSLPYAIVARSAPPHQVGVHMGIHNLFLVAPQLVGSVVLGPLLDTWFGGHARAMPFLAAALFLAAACASFGRDRTP